LGKICFLADARSPHTLKWVRGCADLQWEIIVISHHPGEIPGAQVVVHPLTLSGFLKYCWGVRKLVRTLKPDVIHAHQFGAHALYAWFTGISPLVISAWGSDILVKPKQSKLIRWLTKFLVRRATLITSDSRLVDRELKAYGARDEQLMAILFGIERQRYQRLAEVSKDHSRLILCSPRLHEPLYNIQTLIESFVEAKREYPGLELWLLGSGSLTPMLERLVESTDFAGSIHFWGMVSPQESLERMAQSHLMISIPSSDATPVSLLEAMAAGALPILSELPAYHDWITHEINGLFIKPDFSDLASILIRAAQDRSLREKAAEINRKIILERAIWEDQFQPMLKFYASKGKGFQNNFNNTNRDGEK
jgi:glycosyltransferase involved in cell wall biosynthesis